MNTTAATLSPAAISQALAVRRERAKREALNYGLFRQPNGTYSVVSRQGRVYEATATSCTCADFTNRGQEISACKHVYLVRTAEEEREERTQAERVARSRRLMAEDFPSDDPFETFSQSQPEPTAREAAEERAWREEEEAIQAYEAWLAEQAENGEEYPCD